MRFFTDSRKNPAPVEYSAVSYWLTVLVIILLAAIFVVFGTLSLMYRSDAKIALGNAKTLRTALETASVEAYGQDAPFSDPSLPGGVSEEVWREVLLLSKAPGEFELIRTGKNGYGVEAFIYYEGDMIVTYTADPLKWTVRGSFNLINAEGK